MSNSQSALDVSTNTNALPASAEVATHAAKSVKKIEVSLPVVSLVIAGYLTLLASVAGLVWFQPTAAGDDAMTSVDRACVALLHHGGVPADCTRMYRLEVMP